MMIKQSKRNSELSIENNLQILTITQFHMVLGKADKQIRKFVQIKQKIKGRDGLDFSISVEPEG